MSCLFIFLFYASRHASYSPLYATLKTGCKVTTKGEMTMKLCSNCAHSKKTWNPYTFICTPRNDYVQDWNAKECNTHEFKNEVK